MKENNRCYVERVCPHCGRSFVEPPALSRVDNQTMVCPDCGVREALAAIGCQPDEVERILETIRAATRKKASP